MSEEKSDFKFDILKEFEEFIGLSFEEIAHRVSVNSELIGGKSSIVSLVNRMLDYKNLNKKYLSGHVRPNLLSFKTIRLELNGKPRESMSFEQVNFIEMVEEEWEESKLRKKFAETIFVFVVFQCFKNNDESSWVFKGVKVWQMPKETLDTDVKKLWEDTREILSNGVKLKEKVGIRTTMTNNLPKKNDNNVAHIRPKGKDRNDKVELPDGQMITKQAYWLNNDYIANILKDLPDVAWRKVKQNESSNFPEHKLNLFFNKFNEMVYTVDEFIEKAKQIIPDFTEQNLNYSLLSSLDFKLDNRFVVSNQLNSLDQYINDMIFKSNYFQVPKNPIFKHPYVKRKVENFENDFKILKIEDGLYITNKTLIDGGIKKQDILSYKEHVERFVRREQFFTLGSLRLTNFTHELEDYGFDDIFYESILKRPGRLKNIKIANQFVFVKSKRDVSISDFLSYLMGDSKTITVESFIDRTMATFKLDISYDYAVRIMKSATYYYSEDLLKLYEDKEDYLTEVYDRD